jgi:hypothetical protein
LSVENRNARERQHHRECRGMEKFDKHLPSELDGSFWR